MKSKLIEATNGVNWGRFLVGVMAEEWERRPAVPGADYGRPVLREAGWDPRGKDMLVLDLVTREGAVFSYGGYAHGDLMKHKVWVCPLFEPFLDWLYQQPWEKVAALDLPDYTELQAPADLQGYRRPGWREKVAALSDEDPPVSK